MGDSVLSAQAMKISGGTSPKTDSDAKNTAKIVIGS